MDLKIKDVAELLNLSETTIRRWLTLGKIPAYKINGQYRFSRIEIEDWVMLHKLDKTYGKSPFEAEVSTTTPRVSEGKRQFSLMRAIYRGGVYHDVPGNTKEEVIRNTMRLFAKECDLDAEVLSDLLLDRERLMPTSLNNGLAVPHARDYVREKYNLIAVAFPKKPIDYGALDGKPVYCLFFLFAAEDSDHLHLLAKIAHLSSNQETLDFLQTKPDKSALLDYIKSWESRISREPERELSAVAESL